jgi:hypothetical protein
MSQNSKGGGRKFLSMLHITSIWFLKMVVVVFQFNFNIKLTLASNAFIHKIQWVTFLKLFIPIHSH